MQSIEHELARIRGSRIPVSRRVLPEALSPEECHKLLENVGNNSSAVLLELIAEVELWVIGTLPHGSPRIRVAALRIIALAGTFSSIYKLSSAAVAVSVLSHHKSTFINLEKNPP